ncbi:hypothetical protein DRO30_04625 [Candidatus Bathyarchaeota archaeon]|nr:MAG: hypothetical protein DRO30_04625 [Candidatus Bathyarchaeota archaeon]
MDKIKLHFRSLYALEQHRKRLIRIGIDPRDIEVKYEIETGKLYLLVPNTISVSQKAQLSKLLLSFRK